MTDKVDINQLNWEKLDVVLKVIPDEIRAKENEVIAFVNKLEALKQDAEKTKAVVMSKIANATVQDLELGGIPTSKKKFKNQDAREAELIKQLEENSEFTKKQDEINVIERKKSECEVDLNYFNNVRKASYYLVMLRKGEDDKL